jgi:ketosteroid isomerase-like protein
VNERDLLRLAEGFERYNAGDIEAVLAIADPEIHAHIPMTMVNSGDYYGRDGFREMLESWHSAWAEFSNDVDQIEGVGDDRVVVTVVFNGRGLGSGATVSQRQAYFIEVRDGLMTQWRLFHTRDAAMQHAATL